MAIKDRLIPNHWNHRILATLQSDGTPYFAIHEVHYKNEKPYAHTKNPITISGESVNDLKLTISQINDCFNKPILWGDSKFPQEYKP